MGYLFMFLLGVWFGITFRSGRWGEEKLRLEARIKELEQIMMLHFITTGDDGMPVDEQGEKRARDFKDECGRIIMAAADRCEKELESR